MRKSQCNYKIEPISALDLLDPREKQVLEMRLGIGKYNRPHTLQEISEVVKSKINPEKNLSRERVRNIEIKALRKLKHPNSKCTVIIKGYHCE